MGFKCGHIEGNSFGQICSKILSLRELLNKYIENRGI